MKAIIKRRGLLFTALTLVLGFTVLTTTIAAPQLRSVHNFTEIAQSRSATAVGFRAGAARHMLQSPVYVVSTNAADAAQVAEAAAQAMSAGTMAASAANMAALQSSLGVEIWEHNKTDGVPAAGPPPANSTQWVHGMYLDVLSALPNANVARDPALPDYGIIVPGSRGSYRFTLMNLESFECSYEFTILEGPHPGNHEEYLDFPMEYRLTDDETGLLADWMTLDLLKQETFTGVLEAGESREFYLEWRWPFHIDDAQDQIDTMLGLMVQDEETIPFYQLQLLIRVEADVEIIWIYFFDEDGTPMPPYRISTQAGVRLRDFNIPDPQRTGYIFMGWYDRDGNRVDLDSEILGDLHLYARWRPVNGDELIGIYFFDEDGTPLPPHRISAQPGSRLRDFNIPDPQRPGYVFLGWYDRDGNRVDPDSQIWEDLHLYARWRPVEPGECEREWPDLPLWLLPLLPLLPTLVLPLLPPALIALICVICWRICRRSCACVCEDDRDATCTDEDDEPDRDPGADGEFVRPPQTGDSATVALGALALLVLSGAATVFLRRKRREQEA